MSKTTIDSISAENLTISGGGIRAGGKNVIRTPKSYSWEPQEDITAYELAQCMLVLITAIMGFPVEHAINQLPQDCNRHFREV